MIFLSFVFFYSSSLNQKLVASKKINKTFHENIGKFRIQDWLLICDEQAIKYLGSIILFSKYMNIVIYQKQSNILQKNELS